MSHKEARERKATKGEVEREAEMIKEHGPRLKQASDNQLLAELAGRHNYKKGIALLAGTKKDASDFRTVFDQSNVSSFEVIGLLKHAGQLYDTQRQRVLMSPTQAPPNAPPQPQEVD